MLVTMLAQSIISVDSGSGEIVWQYDCNDYQGKPKEINPNTPTYSDDCIYVTSGYGKGGARLKLAEDGKTAPSKQWANLMLDCHHGGVVLVDGYIYGTNHGGEWVCVDWKDGSRKVSDQGHRKRLGGVCRRNAVLLR